MEKYKTIPPYMDYDVRTSKEEPIGTLVEIDLTRELRIADTVELILGDYEIKVKEGKTYLVKKKPQYPKNYDECCEVLGMDSTINHVVGTHFRYSNRIMSFIKLLICRDAYWKIANNWKPTKDDEGKTYSLFYNRFTDAIEKFNGIYESNAILDFPTAEMRDTFYENFRNLIEACKELL